MRVAKTIFITYLAMIAIVVVATMWIGAIGR